MAVPFRDRAEGGRVLARELDAYANRSDVLVLGLPRGGVPVAYQVATALRVPLDVFVVRKIGMPGHEEFAMGAIASGGARLLNADVIEDYGVPPMEVERTIAVETRELTRRELLYRGDRSFPDLTGKTVILVDDGLATGSSMRVAVKALRQDGPAAIVVAVPVAASETCEAFRDVSDEIVCAVTPEPFFAVGMWYEDFSQTSDEEVRDLLERARREENAAARETGRARAPIR
jgi:putative phosphoribosyl transferase